MAVTFTASLLAWSVGQAMVQSAISWAATETASWAINQGLDALAADPNGEITRADLYGVVRQIQGVQSSLDDLSGQLSNSVLQMRQDSLNAPMARIRAHYKTIGDIFDTAFVIADRNLTEEDHAQQMGRLQRRYDDRLQACANDIPGWLTQINTFMSATGERAFMRQLSQQVWNESPDVVAYYSRSKTVVLDYWITVAQGIDLLRLAHGSPNVNFDEGQLTINRHIHQLEDQERNFARFVGKETIALAEAILLDPSKKLPYTWETNMNTFAQAESVGTTNTRISVNTNVSSEWIMDPWPPVNVETFDPLRGFPVAIRQVGQTGILCPGGRHGLALEPFARPTCTWSIKPRQPGNSRFSFKFISGLVRRANNNYYVISRPAQGVAGRILSLLPTVHREDGNHFFSIHQHRSAAAGGN